MLLFLNFILLIISYLTPAKLEFNNNKLKKIIVACDKENIRELKAMSNVIQLEVISYQNEILNNLSNGKPLMFVMNQDLLLTDIVLINERYSSFLEKYLNTISNLK